MTLNQRLTAFDELSTASWIELAPVRMMFDHIPCIWRIVYSELNRAGSRPHDVWTYTAQCVRCQGRSTNYYQLVLCWEYISWCYKIDNSVQWQAKDSLHFISVCRCLLWNCREINERIKEWTNNTRVLYLTMPCAFQFSLAEYLSTGFEN